MSEKVNMARLVAIGAVVWLALPALLAAPNPVPMPVRTGARTNPAPAPVVRPAPRTNAAPAAPARPGTKTKAVAGAKTATTKAGPGLVETLRGLPAKPWFYPAAGGLGVLLAALVAFFVLKAKRSRAAAGPAAAPEPKPVRRAQMKARKVTIHSCNVLRVGAEERQLWHFDARTAGFVLGRQQTSFAGEPLPRSLVAKDWRTLFQHKLNVAWLPPEQVFLRVAQFPLSDFEETLSMVELQLEKLSPMPVAQIAWTIHVLPHAEENMQTVVVMIAGRNAVEEFLGKLEGQGYLADRLELPVLDQLGATAVTEDGAWIYPTAAGANAALVAWWYGGVLRSLDLVTLSPDNPAEGLKEQLMQMAWAGELDGWLTAPPRWHLVAEGATLADWGPPSRAGLEPPPEIVAPLSPPELAALTARRAAQADPRANLLPAEFTARYRNEFVDRLWMRGLGAVVGIYLVGVMIYFVALEVALFRTRAVEQQVAELGPTYTNAIQLRDRFKVLTERQELRFAALDCWNLVARLMPESLTLDTLKFTEGKKLMLTGTAPTDQVADINDFESAMRKAPLRDQPMFDANTGEHFTYRPQGPGTVSWNFTLELKRAEAQ